MLWWEIGFDEYQLETIRFVIEFALRKLIEKRSPAKNVESFIF